ncbi:PadR family transcriptional regulator [Achromobacter xylosoxidans]|uniref:PadR family transcriptional regulator n=1 Tax=Alcaligenes xylosoxydans xylosoxydans TaxID=85698 RepID=UPI001EE9D95C
MAITATTTAAKNSTSAPSATIIMNATATRANANTVTVVAPATPPATGTRAAAAATDAMPAAGAAAGSAAHGAAGGGGDADDSFGGDGRHFARGRKVTADDLQLMLLGLLEQNPSHGYELIKALGAMSNGFYTPSPGMVYPALTYLEELGYATVEQEGSKKRYHLADAGRAHLQANRERLSVMFNKLKHVARKMDWMRQAWSGEPRVAAGDEDAAGWIDEFVHARQAIRHALLQRTDASPAEQRRIAAILRRATEEITGKDPA